MLYCPECGIENKDTAKFCLECGARIKPQPTVPDVNFLRSEKTVYEPSVGLILLGIVIILAMYIIPIFPMPSLTGKTIATLAQIQGLCSTFSILVACPPWVSLTFYLGWGIGIVFIVIGIFNKKKVIIYEP